MQGVRHLWSAGGGRVHHADAGLRQHQRARHHDRREAVGPDQAVLARQEMMKATRPLTPPTLVDIQALPATCSSNIIAV